MYLPKVGFGLASDAPANAEELAAMTAKAIMLRFMDFSCFGYRVSLWKAVFPKNAA
jgi:hypothetical protein